MSQASLTEWPADKVERRQIETLVPYANNARTHTDAQVAQIAASIQQWGWTVPVLLDEDGGIIAGHARVLAARQLGITEVPCMVATGWTDAQKRAYVIADNRLSELAGWDDELLSLEFADLGEMDFDLELTGFTLDEIGELAGEGMGLGDMAQPGAQKQDEDKMVCCPKCGCKFEVPQ